MRLYCWFDEKETDHQRRKAADEYAVCRVCGKSNWIDDYPISENEMPNSPLVAARQRYQKEKSVYYARIAQQR